ncbi:vacuolar ATPase assembly protein VMA22 [Pelodytes ibericus]
MAPPAEEQLSAVCEELDLLTLRFMEDLELLSDRRDALNQLVEKGWLSLSQSRYSMGNKFVSSLQYKQDMMPSVLVLDSLTDDRGIKFQAKRAGPAQESMTREALGEVEEIGSAEPAVRHRKGASDTSRPPRVEHQGEKSKGHSLPTSQDPLRWFGILVPQSLRQAQTSFREGIVLAAEVVSLQSSIDNIQTQYRSLLAKKKEFVQLN